MPIVFGGLSQNSSGTSSTTGGSGIYIPGGTSVPFDANGVILGEVVWYVDPDGNEINLSTLIEEQYKAGITGRWSAPVDHFSESVPEQDGARYRGTRVLPNQIVIPLTLVADTIDELRVKVRELAKALNPKKGMGELHVETMDGMHRFANCILESFPNEDPAVAGEQYDAALDLTFRAFDPYWYDDEYVIRNWSNDQSNNTFFPILPLRLGSSTIFGVFEENNEGDTQAWPVWAVQGPGGNFKFYNESTGGYTQFVLNIPTDDQLIIDTRPGIKRVYLNSDPNTSLFPYFYGSLWSLKPGTNVISVELTDTLPGSVIEFGYRTGHLGV